ncbi:MAG: hypothetical protein H7Z72_18005 [Bacteroidetes bacterium]|nr:hypothetical protein [Fibrella sp.]
MAQRTNYAAITLLVGLAAVPALYAQDTTALPRSARNPLSAQTRVEVGLGVASPFLNGGSELERARSLRQNGRSYYQGSDGTRRPTGRYPNPIGWWLTTAFYKPLPIRGLMLGAAVRLSLTGSEPADGGYEESYFFNYVSIGPALKYYPSATGKLFLKGEFGLGSVFTKNRYLDSAGQQNFFHHFGIGYAVSIGAGYSITPFANKRKSIDLQAVYQQFGTRVEVNGVGNDPWQFGSLNAGVALSF